MGAPTVEPVKSLPAFSNEPVADFSKPANRDAMQAALREVRAQFGREYDLLIAGRWEKTGDKLKSLNPSRPSEVVGVHSKATTALAKEAVESAYACLPQWRQRRPAARVDMLLKAAALLRKRKLEFDAWMVFEAGKTWPEADADVSEAIDFCEYYARQMARLANPTRCCNSRASATIWCTCRWASAVLSFHLGIFRSRLWWHDCGGSGGREYRCSEALQRHSHHCGEIRRGVARSRFPAAVFLAPGG